MGKLTTFMPKDCTGTPVPECFGIKYSTEAWFCQNCRTVRPEVAVACEEERRIYDGKRAISRKIGTERGIVVSVLSYISGL